MSFWKPISVLLAVRGRAASNDFAENPTAFLGKALLALLLSVAAFAHGSSIGFQWADLSAQPPAVRLSRFLLTLQILWLVALLLPGVVTVLGGSPSRPVLRQFAIRPFQSFLASLMAALMDTPTLIAVAAFLAMLGHLLFAGLLLQAVALSAISGMLALQTCALARLLADGGVLLIRRLRRWAEVPAAAALLLVCVCAGAPPAFASLTTAPQQNPGAIHIHFPSFHTVDPTPALPSGLACRAMFAVRKGDSREALFSFAGLAGLLCGTMAVGFAATRSLERYVSEALPERRSTDVPVPLTRSRPHAGLTRSDSQSAAQSAAARRAGGSLTWIRWLTCLPALVVTEWRLLLRKPETYLPLRQPAGMLLLGVMAFLAPDMGRDPVYNLKELLGLGGVLYNVLWQLQLLCNRFGSEAGTGSLLFSLSMPRVLLLLGKNLALFALLLLLDSAAGAGLLVVAEAPRNIALFLLWLPLALITLTALGNLVSVGWPFSISRPDSRNRGDAPDALAVAYPCLGAAAWLMLIPAALMARGTLGMAAAFAYVIALYVVSLVAAAALLRKHERRTIARLDRNSE